MIKEDIKEFLAKHDVDSSDMYAVCRLFMTDRAQYPTKTPASWGACVKVINNREQEFKNYVKNGIDYGLMDSLGIYGC